MFRLEASQRTRRVSSAAIRLARASSATSPAEASSAPPMGTPASGSTPPSSAADSRPSLPPPSASRSPTSPPGLAGLYGRQWQVPVAATEADRPAAPAADEASRLEVLRARLVTPMPDDGPWGWLGPLLVTAFGAFLRFDRLRVPRALIFDETYYAKDAWSILKHGVEWKMLDAKVANPMIVAGHTNFFVPCNGTSAS